MIENACLKRLQKIEMMRGAAALYVMAGHFLLPVAGEGSLLGLSLRFGQEAVMLFFMISGFVVFHSTEQQQPDFLTYFGRRWIRIYPIFLLSLLLCALDIVFLRSQSFLWRDLVGNLFMLQDFSYGKPGVWFPAFGGNSPLWSLAYEWWFYMLFYPIWRFVAVCNQRAVAVAISIAGLVGYVVHPNQLCLYLMYFTLWWTGVEFARQYRAEGRVTFQGQCGSLALLTGFIGLVGALLLSQPNWSGDLRFGLYPGLQIRHFLACLTIAAGALCWQRANWCGFCPCFGVFRHIAPISYGVYVLHYPIGISGSFLQSIPDVGVRLSMAAIVSLGMACFAEGPFQRLINDALRKHLPREQVARAS